MKKVFITIMLMLSLTATAQTHYGSRVKYVIRKSTVHNRMPTSAMFNYTNTWCWNTTDSIIYTKTGTQITQKYKFCPYSATVPATLALSLTAGSYSNTIYPYYVRISTIAGNIPPLSDFTYSNTWCWNTTDHKIYTKISGAVRVTYSIYNYALTPTPIPTPDCNYTYGVWTPEVCPPNGIQSRVLISALPEGCSQATPPVLSRSCTYVPPVVPPPVYQSADWWVSATGNDSNIGDSLHPFYTIQKAYSKSNPGDLTYVRGGTYNYPTKQTLQGRSGTATDTIKIFAYPGEVPILNKASSFTYGTGYQVGFLVYNISYVHFKGLEVSGFSQPVNINTNDLYAGIMAYNMNHCVWEQLNYHNNGCCFQVHGNLAGDCSNNLFLNSDFHHNSDPYTGGSSLPYDNADGLEIGYCKEGAINTVTGCRFWCNSDDGIDLWANNGTVNISDCWSFWNGYSDNGITRYPNAINVGFKLGGLANTETPNTLKRTVIRCLAYGNTDYGFACNNAKIKMNFQNCTAYKNVTLGTQFVTGFWVSCTSGTQQLFTNCISYANMWTNGGLNDRPVYIDASSLVYTSSFIADRYINSAFTVTDNDFISVSPVGIDGARGVNGALPVINFLKLKVGSDLINSGTDCGLPYNGSKPDLGCFESNY